MSIFYSRSALRAQNKHLIQRFRASQLELQYENSALTSDEPGTVFHRDVPLIVSLTSYGHRLGDVHKTVESLFRQSTKADRIILWLSAREHSPEFLPELTKRQMKRGLEVRFCERDLGPYTKYHYTLQEFPDSLILTVDDDILYPPDMIEQLYQAYRSEPEIVHCHRAHKIKLAADGTLLPYKKWAKNTGNTEAGHLIFPTGVGGVLYFPGCFAKEVSDVESFLQLSPKADDVWLKAMTLKNGVLSKRLSASSNWGLRFLTVEGSQLTSLKRANKSSTAGNDAKLRAVFDHYDLKFDPDQG